MAGRPAAPRHGVDEADEVDPVLGVLEELARDELADVAGADDDRVLEVGELMPAGGTRRDACERDGDDREQPERDHAADVGSAKPEIAHDRDEQPGAER